MITAKHLAFIKKEIAEYRQNTRRSHTIGRIDKIIESDTAEPVFKTLELAVKGDVDPALGILITRCLNDYNTGAYDDAV